MAAAAPRARLARRRPHHAGCVHEPGGAGRRDGVLGGAAGHAAPTYQPQFTTLVDQFTKWLGERGVTQEQIDAAVSQFDLDTLVGVLQRVVSGTTNVVSDLAFILALLFFLIIDSSSFPRRLTAAAAQRPQLVEALTGFAGATRQYIVISTVFGLIVALADVAALYWLDVPLPWLWGYCRSSPTTSPTSGSCSA